MAEDQNPPADEQDQNNNERKRPGKKPLIILGIVVIVMVIVALVWWFITRNEETTDDAFTDGDVVTIAPKTAGYVTELRVRDNQRVKKGDVLVAELWQKIKTHLLTSRIKTITSASARGKNR